MRNKHKQRFSKQLLFHCCTTFQTVTSCICGLFALLHQLRQRRRRCRAQRVGPLLIARQCFASRAALCVFKAGGLLALFALQRHRCRSLRVSTNNHYLRFAYCSLVYCRRIFGRLCGNAVAQWKRLPSLGFLFQSCSVEMTELLQHANLCNSI